MSKEIENFFDNAGQIRSKIYFKLGLCQLFKKALVSKNQHCSQFTFKII